MIDLQNHIRNRDALNLFDGRGYKPAKRPGTRFLRPSLDKPSCEDLENLWEAVAQMVYERVD